MKLGTDYDAPRIEKITAEIIKGVVPDEHVGTSRINGMEYHEAEQRIAESGYFDPKDYTFVTVRRRGGYFTDSMTDIIGLEVQVWARDSIEASETMDQITKRILDAEGNTYLGFLIDFVSVLNGPEETYPPSMDDRCVEKSFEVHIRVRWH